MDGRDSSMVTEMARRVAEEAGQAVRRSIDIGLSVPTGAARRVRGTGVMGGAVPSLAGGSARFLARGPSGMAYEAVDFACRLVESACDASRWLAGTVLGQESARPLPAGSAAGAAFRPATAGLAGAPRTGSGIGGPSRTAPAGVGDEVARPRSITSPLLQDTGWAGRVASPTAVSVAPGEVASVRIYVENRSSTRMRSVRLRSTDLVSAGGGLIDDTALEIQPALVDLQAQSSVPVDVEVRVPADAPRGRYTGVIAVLGLPAASSAIEIDVR